MWKMHIRHNVVLYVTLLFIASSSNTQATTTTASPRDNPCDIMEMEKELIAKKPALKSIVGKFTPRSIFQELKEKKCTSFIGDLKVNSEGANENGLNESVSTNDLDSLKSMTNILGNVELELSEYPDITNLSFFQNLNTIFGNVRTPVKFSVLNSQLTSLFPPIYNLDFTVQTIELINNTKLCYLENIFKISSYRKFNISGNKNVTVCKQENKTCYSSCFGCYGPGNFCMQCNGGYWAKKHNLYSSCSKCAPECTYCSGPGNSYPDCECKFVQHNGKCLSSPKCPNATRTIGSICEDCSSYYDPPVYNITTAGFITCKSCNAQCVVRCSGNSSRDCSRCRNFKHFYEKNKFECVQKCPPQAPKSHEDATGENVCGEARALESMSVLIMMAISSVVSKILYW